MNRPAKPLQSDESARPPRPVANGAPSGDSPPAETSHRWLGDEDWETARDFAIMLIAFVVTIVALYLARSIVMPVVAALMVGISLHPVQKRAETYGIPPALMAIALVAVFSGLLYLAVSLTIGPISDWIEHAPQLGENIKEKLRWFERPLNALRDLQASLGVSTGHANQPASIEANLTAILQETIGIVTPAITEFLLFLGTLLFFLVGIGHLRRQLITFFETRDARLRVVRIWNDIEDHLMSYVVTVTSINLGLGIVTTGMLYALGFPNPITFGLIAFFLNYVPYLGPAIMVATLTAVGVIVMPSLGSAAIAPILFVALTTTEGHFITPSIIGRRLTLSPLLVFLALAFWTWLWGAFGAFLSTPLLIVGLVLLGHLFPQDEVSLPE